MNAQSLRARLLPIIVAAGVCTPLPLYGQSGFAAGAGAGALVGAMVSASHPIVRCSGGRSFTCGAGLHPGPLLAGALIGGIIGHAVTTPPAFAPVAPIAPYGVHFVPEGAADTSQRSVSRGSPFAQDWQRFFEADRERPAEHSSFIEHWNRFYEPHGEHSRARR